ncbi:MAG: DUF1656 domain-containing protein [Plesiomonas sp.]|uniref:DUF1656 domain-containing protein n=1 Tax=Plesiomonas sp. TaxID=2486279 RepID=UPI003F312F84
MSLSLSDTFLAHDVVFFDIYIPRLVMLGLLAFITMSLLIHFISRRQWLRHLWHPRLVLWISGCALLALFSLLYQ